MVKPYTPLYHSYLEAIEELGDAERGRLLTAMLRYGITGAAEKLSGNERYVFPMIRAQMDRDNAAYEAKCQENRENGRLGGRPKKPNGLDQNRTVFEKPKEKEKDKEKKTTTPLPPFSAKENPNARPPKADAEGIFEDYSFSEQIKDAVSDWMEYKKERRGAYKPMGLKSLMTKIQNKLNELSEEQVMFVIRESMACNYQGIIWDKVRDFKQKQHYSSAKTGDKDGDSL